MTKLPKKFGNKWSFTVGVGVLISIHTQVRLTRINVIIR